MAPAKEQQRRDGGQAGLFPSPVLWTPGLLLLGSCWERLCPSLPPGPGHRGSRLLSSLAFVLR